MAVNSIVYHSESHLAGLSLSQGQGVVSLHEMADSDELQKVVGRGSATPPPFEMKKLY